MSENGQGRKKIVYPLSGNQRKVDITSDWMHQDGRKSLSIPWT